MGSIIKAICKCGFESEKIFAGGGLRNFQAVCAAPAICLNCRRFLVLDYMKNRKCPNCGKEVSFYNEPSLQAQMNESMELENVFSWHLSDEAGDFQLPNKQYLCPNCGKMTLKFILIGNWD